jgi:hypothetical protein
VGLLVGGIGGTLRSSTPILFALVSGFQWFALGSTFYGMSPFVTSISFFAGWFSHLLHPTNPRKITTHFVRPIWTKYYHQTPLSPFAVALIYSPYLATRGVILRYHYIQIPTPEDTIRASAAAGGISGASIGGLISTSPLRPSPLYSHFVSDSHLYSWMIGGRRNFLPAMVIFSLFGWAGQSLYNELDARHTQKIQSSNTLPTAAVAPSFLQKLAGMKYSPMKILSDAEYEEMLRERLLHVDAEIALVDEKIEVVKEEIEKGTASDGIGSRDREKKIKK